MQRYTKFLSFTILKCNIKNTVIAKHNTNDYIYNIYNDKLMIIICGLKVINNIYVIYILYILKKSNAKHKKFV